MTKMFDATGLSPSDGVGLIDDFAIYCEALAPNQIAALASDSVRPDNILPEAAIAPLAAVDPCLWSMREI